MKEPKYSHIKMYQTPDNYAGSTFPEYYCGLSITRDSDFLEKCNYMVMLEALGGESKTVITTHCGHWAVGWVEQILVHKSAKKKLRILNDLMKKYELYPILDDSAYSDARQEYIEDTFEQFKDEFRKEFLFECGLTEKPKNISYKDIDSLTHYLYSESVYENDEDSWVSFKGIDRNNAEDIVCDIGNNKALSLLLRVKNEST